MVSIIIAILVFSFLILTHELGHFLFAKRGGIGVIEFSVGMGPRLISKQIGETRYSIKCIPFGGSCMMVGEDVEDPAENAFHRKSVWTRILVVAGGPMFNIITAWILSIFIVIGVGVNPAKIYQVYPGYSAENLLQIGDVVRSVNGHKVHVGRDLILLSQEDLQAPGGAKEIVVDITRDGEKMSVSYDPLHTSYRLGISYYADDTQAVLSTITEGTPAAEAGLREGDRITAINGTPIQTGRQIQDYFQVNVPDGSEIVLEYERDQEKLSAVITPGYHEEYSLGFAAYQYYEKTGPVGVVIGSVQEVGYWLRYTIMSLRMLFTRKVAVSDLSGPVGVVSVISQTVESSAPDGLFYIIMNILNLSILLSVNLGVMNLLPIPALDGGRLVFLIIEAIRGKALPPDKEGMVHMMGFFLLMILMVMILFNDVFKIFAGKL